MSDLFHQMQAEVLAARVQGRERKRKSAPKPRVKAKPQTVYLVAAWMGFVEGGSAENSSRWKIHRQTHNDDFGKQEDAEAFARSLSACWTNRTIIRVDLPGEQA